MATLPTDSTVLHRLDPIRRERLPQPEAAFAVCRQHAVGGVRTAAWGVPPPAPNLRW